jgi:hypothetical protein
LAEVAWQLKCCHVSVGDEKRNELVSGTAVLGHAYRAQNVLDAGLELQSTRHVTVTVFFIHLANLDQVLRYILHKFSSRRAFHF